MTAEHLAAEFGTPLIVVDEDDVRERCRTFAVLLPASPVRGQGVHRAPRHPRRARRGHGPACVDGRRAVRLSARRRRPRPDLHARQQQVRRRDRAGRALARGAHQHRPPRRGRPRGRRRRGGRRSPGRAAARDPRRHGRHALVHRDRASSTRSSARPSRAGSRWRRCGPRARRPTCRSAGCTRTSARRSCPRRPYAQNDRGALRPGAGDPRRARRGRRRPGRRRRVRRPLRGRAAAADRRRRRVDHGGDPEAAAADGRRRAGGGRRAGPVRGRERRRDALPGGHREADARRDDVRRRGRRHVRQHPADALRRPVHDGARRRRRRPGRRPT